MNAVPDPRPEPSAPETASLGRRSAPDNVMMRYSAKRLAWSIVFLYSVHAITFLVTAYLAIRKHGQLWTGVYGGQSFGLGGRPFRSGFGSPPLGKTASS